MAHGKTLDLNALDRQFGYRTIAATEATPRDRTLRGKARRKARKAANKASRSTATP